MTTVVIPTFNRADLLRRAVSSAQSAGSDVEVLVVDNASTDGTDEVCRTIPGIRYLRLPTNQGPSGARNAGIAATTTEFVSFLDDDDVLLPGSIDRQVAALRASPEAGFSYGHVLLGNEQCVPTGGVFWSKGEDDGALPQLPSGDIFFHLLGDNPIMMHTAVIRRRCLDSLPLFDPTVCRGEDWDFWVRLSENNRAIALNEPVGVVRMSRSTSRQLTADRRAMHTDSVRLQARWLELPRALSLSTRDRDRLRKQLRRTNAWLLASGGIDEIKRGAISTGCRYVLGALTIDLPSALRRLLLASAMVVARPRRRSTKGVPS